MYMEKIHGKEDLGEQVLSLKMMFEGKIIEIKNG